MAIASITVRNLDDDVRTRPWTRAAGNGRSMEEEVRLILRNAVARVPENLADFIRECFVPCGEVELELPMREPPPSVEAAKVVLDMNVSSELCALRLIA